MALPNLLLQQFQTASISDFIPGKLVQTYKQLEDLAFGIFDKDASQWSVHFHFEDEVCEGKALPFLWNSGGYFDESCLKTGKLPVFAHFGLKPNSSISSSSQSSVQGNAVSSSVNRMSRPILSSSRQTTTDEMTGPRTTREQPEVQKTPFAGGGQSRKRHRVESVSSSSEAEAPTPRRSKRHSCRAEDALPGDDRLDGDTVPPLPPGVTPGRHALDFDAYRVSNPRKGQYGHKDSWSEIGKDYRKKIAHARLIYGNYGIPSPISCDRCVKEGFECRVYHPAVTTNSSVNCGSSCGECRLKSTTCVMDGQHHRHAKPKLSTPDMAQEETAVPKKRSLEYCPVSGCPGAPQGFKYPSQFKRHMEKRHPDVPDTSVKEFKSQFLFPCPVPDCTSKAAKGFSRQYNLDAHIRTAHPTYVGRDEADEEIDYDVEEEDVVPKATGNNYACLVPGCTSRSALGFSRSDALQYHVETKHAGSEYVRAYTSGDDALEARITTESKASDPQTFGKTLQCPVPLCPHVGSFLTISNLQTHINFKHPGFTYPPDNNPEASQMVIELGSAGKATYDCPVKGCSHPTGFFHKHPDYTIVSKDQEHSPIQKSHSNQRPFSREKKVGNYICPVEGCSSISGSFTCADNFRRHIRQAHPNSSHARVLKAIGENAPLRLPLPPFTSAQYQADQVAFRSNNAPPGDFGHRFPKTWGSIQDGVRARIAQGRLVHKYGILAPEACSGCKNRGSTCLVLHPGLEVAASSGKTVCDQCKDKSISCDIQQGMFEKLLERPGSTLAASNDEIDGVDNGVPLDAHGGADEHRPSKRRRIVSEISDSGGPEARMEDDYEYGDGEDDDDGHSVIQVAGLESTPGSSRHEGYDVEDRAPPKHEIEDYEKSRSLSHIPPLAHNRPASVASQHRQGLNSMHHFEQPNSMPPTSRSSHLFEVPPRVLGSAPAISVNNRRVDTYGMSFEPIEKSTNPTQPVPSIEQQPTESSNSNGSTQPEFQNFPKYMNLDQHFEDVDDEEMEGLDRNGSLRYPKSLGKQAAASKDQEDDNEDIGLDVDGQPPPGDSGPGIGGMGGATDFAFQYTVGEQVNNVRMVDRW